MKTAITPTTLTPARITPERIKLASITLAAGLWLSMCGACLAQAEMAEMIPPATAPVASAEPQINLPYHHPTLPAEAAWPGATVVLILGMFAAAIGVGVVVRLETPETVPTAHSHDEPPGASHHHGPGGTVQPGPEHDLPGGHSDKAGGHH